MLTGEDTEYPLENMVLSGDYDAFIAAQSGPQAARQWAYRHGENARFISDKQEEEKREARRRQAAERARHLNGKHKPPQRKAQAA